eukprot:CFRG3627T1
MKLPPAYFKKAKIATRKTWFIFVGNILEWYEFSVFGYLVNEIEHNFFKDSGSMATWSAYAVTFLARPVGALMLGWVADHCGRRTALLISLLGMIISTVGQGCLPTYYCCGEGAGLAGLVLLIIMRVVQGICTGGEIGGVSTYLAEHEDKDVLGMLSATVGMGGAIGFMLSSLVIMILHLALTTDEMLLWGWRIPFLIALIPGVIAMFGRNNLVETDEFLDMVELEANAATIATENPVLQTPRKFNYETPTIFTEKAGLRTEQSTEGPPSSKKSITNVVTPPLYENDDDFDDITGAHVREEKSFDERFDSETGDNKSDIDDSLSVHATGGILKKKKRKALASADKRSRFPLGSLLKQYPIQTFIVLFGMAGLSCTWYVSIVYSLDYIRDQHGVSPSTALGMAVAGNLASVIFGPVSGILVDGSGVGKQMLIGSFTILCLTLPLWSFFILTESIPLFYILTILMGIGTGLFSACPFLWVAEAFPTNMRASGFFAYNIAVSIFGGCGPLICDALVQNWSKWGPAVYTSVLCLVSFLVVSIGYYLHRTDKLVLAHIRKTPY